jgi:hypothetical protein
MTDTPRGIEVALPTSKQIVRIKEALTYWDLEEVRTSIAGSARMDADIPTDGSTPGKMRLTGFDTSVMITAKRKLFARVILSIAAEDGTAIPFSEEWLDELAVADGKALDSAINKLQEK